MKNRTKNIPNEQKPMSYQAIYSAPKKKKMLKLVPEVPFCTNIGSNPEMNIEPYFLHSLNEPYQIVSPLKIILKLSHKKEQA